MTLTEQQREQFERLGVLRIAGVFGEDDAARMRHRLWEALARAHGMRPAEPATWTIEQPTGFQSLTRAGAFDALGSPVLARALDDLLGGDDWERPDHWGTPLVRFPTRGTSWDLPSSQWHLDFPVRGEARPLFAVRVLGFLDRVELRAGGTLALAGSHRLAERFIAAGALRGGHSRDVCRALMRTSPWFRDLFSAASGERVRRFTMEGASVDGVAVSVLELTGAPGDVVLMHPWQLHAPSPNCGTSPRLVVAHSVVRIGWAAEHLAPRATRGLERTA